MQDDVPDHLWFLPPLSALCYQTARFPASVPGTSASLSSLVIATASSLRLPSGPTCKLNGDHRELRLRTDLQTIDHELTLRSDESGAATELSGNLFVCLSVCEAPQELLSLRRYRYIECYHGRPISERTRH
ncbi:hypothetical protein ABIC03_002023 [Bradyrhizobium sp. RT6a]